MSKFCHKNLCSFHSRFKFFSLPLLWQHKLIIKGLYLFISKAQFINEVSKRSMKFIKTSIPVDNHIRVFLKTSVYIFKSLIGVIILRHSHFFYYFFNQNQLVFNVIISLNGFKHLWLLLCLQIQTQFWPRTCQF